MDADKLLAQARESGGPIIDRERSKVTFVWEGRPETTSVVVQTQLGEPLAPVRLRRVQGSDVWATTLAVDDDVTTAYQFLVDYRGPSPRKLQSLPMEKLMAIFMQRVPHTFADPLNPRRFRPQWFMPGMTGERMESLLVMPGARPRLWSEDRDVPHGSIVDERIASERLDNERGVYVYLPPAYDAARAHPYRSSSCSTASRGRGSSGPIASSTTSSRPDEFRRSSRCSSTTPRRRPG